MPDHLDLTLDPADIRDAAVALNCDVASVEAVLDVEAAGVGFLSDGRPKVLFEAHWFSRLTDGAFDASHPHLSSPQWDASLYRGGAAEHDRLTAALELDAVAALSATSWGLFQILGVNYDLCGFESVDAFAADHKRGERRHLMAFVAYCRARGLDRYLAEHDWEAFARAYNGPAFARHGYRERLADAHARRAAGRREGAAAWGPVLSRGSGGAAVRRLQAALDLPVDGIFRGRTAEAVAEFQAENALTPDGVVGPRTWAALRDGGHLGRG
jgi:hypothetical protein